MNKTIETVLALVALAIGAQASAQITFYEHEGFEGRSFTTERPVVNFERFGFNDRASSVVVERDRWEICDDARFAGRCVVLGRGQYPSLAAMGLNDRVSSVRTVDRNARIDDGRYAPIPAPGAAQVTFYEGERFSGRSFTAAEQIGNLERRGFDNRAASLVVVGGPWEVCEDPRFDGRCVVLRPGRYPSPAAMGLRYGVASLRTVGANARVDDNRYAPAPLPVYDARRRGGERLYEADVTAVRAVVGTPGQRCWVEREQVSQDQGLNVPAAIAGAVIGGILGHQVGGGTGKDVATVGGVVGGAALGANIGRDGQGGRREVQRCANVPSGQASPDYWDVTYNFRGQEYRVQMSSQPGTTVTVNDQGEPRS